MKMFSFLLFIFCLNISAYVINQSRFWQAQEELAYNPTDISNIFSWQNLVASLGVAGGVGTIIGITFGFSSAILGGLLIWTIVSFTPIIREFFIGLPITLNSLLPPEMAYVSYVVQAFFAIIFFMFIIEQAGQRQIT